MAVKKEHAESMAQAKEFMARVEAVREQMDMPLGEFARHLGFSFSTYTNWVYGCNVPKLSAITAIIRKVGKPADHMLGITAATAIMVDAEPPRCPHCAKRDEVIRLLAELATQRHPRRAAHIRAIAVSVSPA